jgi:exopolyphosphatase/guanosine-5'-triphosphate,3'-diphosphate pyrophosphatase
MNGMMRQVGCREDERKPLGEPRKSEHASPAWWTRAAQRGYNAAGKGRSALADGTGRTAPGSSAVGAARGTEAMGDGVGIAAARTAARATVRDGSTPDRSGSRNGELGPLYGALDLGTNNCRLLIATPTSAGFRVIDSYSRIVRLGEGLTASGRLGEEAMDRAVAALTVCGERLRRRKVGTVQAVATQACRVAANGAEFIKRVETEAGVVLRVITPREEAHLSVAGCLNLLDRSEDAALVVDVGGGSTELSWVDLTDTRLNGGAAHVRLDRLPVRAWVSIPIGVVSLAELFPEAGDQRAWFDAMVAEVRGRLAAYTRAETFRGAFDAGRAHLIGTSGAITSLAGLHLGLPRYDRSRVDGLWLKQADCTAAAERLLALSPAARAAEPCIGPDRADLVLAGAAILQAVQDLWPCERVRVADRGLREGLLLSVMAESRSPRRGRRRRRGGSA